MKKLFVTLLMVLMMVTSLSAESIIEKDLAALTELFEDNDYVYRNARTLREIRSSMEGQTTHKAYKPTKKKTRYSRYENIQYVIFFEESLPGVTHNWGYIKQNLDDVGKYVFKLVRYYPQCTNEEAKTLLKNVIYYYYDLKDSVEWAEEHFKPRGGYDLTLSSEEYEYFHEWRTCSAKQYNSAYHAYQHWLSNNR